jgi:drug/metabolite transporter (DMT)-like permease
VVATLLSVAVLSEPVTWRLVVAGLMVLAGLSLRESASRRIVPAPPGP